MTVGDYGFTTPGNSDLIRQGDDAITNNAEKTAEALNRLSQDISDADWKRPPIVEGDDLDNYFDESSLGTHPVLSRNVANLPVKVEGTLEVLEQGYSVAQVYVSYIFEGAVRVFVRSTVQGVPAPWQEIGGAGLNTRIINFGGLNDYALDTSKAGYYRVTTTAVANLPVNAVGIFAAIPMSNGNMQYYSAWYANSPPKLFTRYGSGEWTDVTAGTEITIDQGAGSDRGVITQGAALAVFNARLIEHAESPVPIVFAGSSTIAGQGADTPAGRWVNQVVRYLQGKYPGAEPASEVQDSSTGAYTPNTSAGVHGYNIGRGGAQAVDYLTDADTSAIAALDPALIVHMVGSNDYVFQRPIATYKADLKSRIAHLSDAITVPHTHLLVHQFQRKDLTAPGVSWEQYSLALQEIADENPGRVAFMDLAPAFRATGTLDADPLGYIGNDNIHTTPAGHRFLAHLVSIGLGEK